MSGGLTGLHALVTSGPTFEPVDPVRFLGNRSSGRQGHAIAAALAAAGARVTLVSGPVHLADPAGARVAHVETASEMLAACEQALPADIAICVAAVGDWRAARPSGQKMKKDGSGRLTLELVENPDILAALSRPSPRRPRLVVGFAAETENLLEHASAKRARKGCDWLVANDVSGGGGFGEEENKVTLITQAGAEPWPRLRKEEIAARLVAKLAAAWSGA